MMDSTLHPAARKALAASIGLAALLALGSPMAASAQAIPANIEAALSNAARPEADRKADATRKPAELLMFAGVKAGDRVLELIPGGGYFARIFSNVVGPSGHVDELVTAEETKTSSKNVDVIKVIAAEPAFPNITLLVQPVAEIKPSQPVDLVWTSQNYHDLHDKAFGPADMVAFNKAIFNALKPGGVFMVVDHAAEAGSGFRDTETLHRIDPAAAKAEIEAAGFVLESQSDMLRDPSDTHAARIFDPTIRGKTDKFVFKFRKPVTAK